MSEDLVWLTAAIVGFIWTVVFCQKKENLSLSNGLGLHGAAAMFLLIWGAYTFLGAFAIEITLEIVGVR